MSDTKLKQQILDSLADLKNRYSYLSDNDIAADIINVVCRDIITSKDFNYKTSAQPLTFFQYNWNNCSSFIKKVIMSLENELCGIITEQTSQSLTENICFNLGWSEMPTFLDNYFSEKHGQTLGKEREAFDFMSVRHERYINKSMVASSQVDRNIKVTCWNNRKNMSIEIIPTLSLKRAHLEYKSNNLYFYRGEDPDYMFEVRFDNFDEINYVSVSLSSRNLKLSYY